MTLIVEDGTGLQDANGYISVAYADAYHAARGNDAWVALLAPTKEAAIISASTYMDSTNHGRWLGVKLTSEQGLDWPREGAYDERGAPYVGLPGNLEEAAAEYALREAQAPLDPDPTYDASGRVVTETDDRVEGAVMERRKFAWGGQTVSQRKYPTADRLLRPLKTSARMLVRV